MISRFPSAPIRSLRRLMSARRVPRITPVTSAAALPVLLFVGGTVIPSQSQEVFGWWRRGLLDLDLTPGSWVYMESEELSEGQLVSDRFRCTILAADPDGARWVAVSVDGKEERWVLKMASEDSLRGDSILDGLLALYRMTGDQVETQDVQRMRENRFVRRHFQDLFTNPQLTRETLPDSVVGQATIRRERVRLTETTEQRVTMGSRERIYVDETTADAVLSADVPVFGVITSSTEATLSESGEESPLPPLTTLYRLRLLDFGHEEAPGLPAPLAKRLKTP